MGVHKDILPEDVDQVSASVYDFGCCEYGRPVRHIVTASQQAGKWVDANIPRDVAPPGVLEQLVFLGILTVHDHPELKDKATAVGIHAGMMGGGHYWGSRAADDYFHNNQRYELTPSALRDIHKRLRCEKVKERKRLRSQPVTSNVGLQQELF